jgi:hypothetical protein
MSASAVFSAISASCRWKAMSALTNFGGVPVRLAIFS